ncbi:hypothetical protein CRUP_000619 [Coryphaenoides rupestris]|nr:hypothetical protein CRUP_000619 [Coryphaenoides rupestris]
MLSLRTILLLLSCAALLLGSSAAPSDTALRQLLQRSLLAPMQGNEDLVRSSLAQLLAQSEALEAGEPGAAGRDLERSSPMLAPRERKAGCKNFFWKTFTSC